MQTGPLKAAAEFVVDHTPQFVQDGVHTLVEGVKQTITNENAQSVLSSLLEMGSNAYDFAAKNPIAATAIAEGVVVAGAFLPYDGTFVSALYEDLREHPFFIAPLAITGVILVKETLDAYDHYQKKKNNQLPDREDQLLALFHKYNPGCQTPSSFLKPRP